MKILSVKRWEFQPTLPMRGATALELNKLNDDVFQPTLPMRGATSQGMDRPWTFFKFQPTLPMRGATSTVLPEVPAD